MAFFRLFLPLTLLLLHPPSPVVTLKDRNFQCILGCVTRRNLSNFPPPTFPSSPSCVTRLIRNLWTSANALKKRKWIRIFQGYRCKALGELFRMVWVGAVFFFFSFLMLVVHYLIVTKKNKKRTNRMRGFICVKSFGVYVAWLLSWGLQPRSACRWSRRTRAHGYLFMNWLISKPSFRRTRCAACAHAA